MKYDYVIFDLDGTLLDTLDDLCDSTNEALSAFGLPKRTRDEVRAFVGNGIGLLIERAVPSGTSAEITSAVFESFKKYYSANCRNKTKPYDGIKEMLEVLKAKNIKTAVVSNKIDSAVKELSASFFPEIDIALGEKNGVRRKPEADMLLNVLGELSADKGRSVYVGDSDVDIETAKNAGLDCISVTWGFRDRDFLTLHGAERFADRPYDIVKLTEDNDKNEVV